MKNVLCIYPAVYSAEVFFLAKTKFQQHIDDAMITTYFYFINVYI